MRMKKHIQIPLTNEIHCTRCCLKFDLKKARGPGRGASHYYRKEYKQVIWKEYFLGNVHKYFGWGGWKIFQLGHQNLFDPPQNCSKLF